MDEAEIVSAIISSADLVIFLLVAKAAFLIHLLVQGERKTRKPVSPADAATSKAQQPGKDILRSFRSTSRSATIWCASAPKPSSWARFVPQICCFSTFSIPL